MQTNAVGYKKPPKNTQFKKGKSGNPKGRPRGSTNKTTFQLLEKELNSTFKLKDGTSISKKEATIKNFSNNAFQTKKLHESARALDLITKVEKENNENELSRDFLNRLVSENYIDMKDAEDFARGRKNPTLNFPKAIYEIDNTVRIKRVTAWEGVKKVELLAKIYNLMDSISVIEKFTSIIKDEIFFWEKAKVMFRDFSVEDQKEIFSILQKTRGLAKPDFGILFIINAILKSQKSYLKACMFITRDLVADSDFYKEEEQSYFDEDRVFKEFSKSNEVPVDMLMNSHKSDYEDYKTFMALKDNKNEADEDLQALRGLDWSKVDEWKLLCHDATMSYREAIDEINDKYDVLM